ncbi:hypothetical protein B0T25DRAFT_306904 [Lasiosphaeria hispida]|uniref:Uncharacterized protein n=1 Tax=Lasiosphaeria hispida TaxID=260671 RepID=A0AAJ0H8J2_9PEZI|nr:hypothetical protein B0T25DRAFT_306904 [Lasiosphaeria hispida]
MRWQLGECTGRDWLWPGVVPSLIVVCPGAPQDHRRTTWPRSRIGTSSGVVSSNAMPHLEHQHRPPASCWPYQALHGRPSRFLAASGLETGSSPGYPFMKQGICLRACLLLGMRPPKRPRVHWSKDHGNISAQCETTASKTREPVLSCLLARLTLLVPGLVLYLLHKGPSLEGAGHHLLSNIPLLVVLIIRRGSIVRVNNASDWLLLLYCSYCSLPEPFSTRLIPISLNPSLLSSS